MDHDNFITGEPNELVANLLTPVAKLGKFGDWKNGYGKYTVAFILLYTGYRILTGDFPLFSINNWVGSLVIYAYTCMGFLIAYYIYKGSFTNNKNLLVINSKAVLHNEQTFFWNDMQSFQLSLEKEMNKRHPACYLHFRSKDTMGHKIDISLYNEKITRNT